MKTLKILVAVMALAILAVLVIIVVTLGERLMGGPPSEAGTAEAALGEIEIPLPEGCTIAQARLHEDRVVLRLAGPSDRGCQQVLLVDLESGRVTTRLTGRPPAAP